MTARLKKENMMLCDICKYKCYMDSSCRAKMSSIKYAFGQRNGDIVQCLFFDFRNVKYAGLIRTPENYEI